MKLIERKTPLEIVELLFQYGLNVRVYSGKKKSPESPLNIVIYKLHQWEVSYRDRWIQLLLDRMDIDFQDKNGDTALHIVSVLGDVKTARLLIQAGAKKDIENNSGRTPIQIARAMSGSRHNSNLKWYWYFSFFGYQHRVIQLLQNQDQVTAPLSICRRLVRRLMTK